MKKLICLILTVLMLLPALYSCGNKNNTDEPSPDSVLLTSAVDHDYVRTLIETGKIDVAILPEPKATAAINSAKKNGFEYSIKLNLSTEWDKVSDSPLSMGCIAVNNSFLSENESEVLAFLAEYKSSIEYIGAPTNFDSSSQMIVSSGVIPALPVAKSALNNLYGSIVYQDGEQMKNTLLGFYDAIGNAKPDNDSFYYIPSKDITPTSDKKIKIAVMNGPTGMGMSKLMNDYGLNSDRYEFILYSDPSLAIVDLGKGEVNMACLPTNSVATFASKGANISALAINCLGSLYVVAKNEIEINSPADLIGKNVYYGVPTSTTAPIFKYIMTKNSINVKDADEE